MPFFTSPTSYRLARVASGLPALDDSSYSPFAGMKAMAVFDPTSHHALPPHSMHPDFLHLTLLVFEAVLEVVCVSLPGYIIARQGMFDAESQKFLANLNVQLFTPCLSK